MRVEFPSLGLMLQPYRGNTCWQLYEWATERTNREGEPVEDGWRAVECYPTTLAHGLSIVMEQALRRSVAAGDLRDAVAEVRRIADDMRAAVATQQSEVPR